VARRLVVRQRGLGPSAQTGESLNFRFERRRWTSGRFVRPGRRSNSAHLGRVQGGRNRTGSGPSPGENGRRFLWGGARREKRKREKKKQGEFGAPHRRDLCVFFSRGGVPGEREFHSRFRDSGLGSVARAETETVKVYSTFKQVSKKPVPAGPLRGLRALRWVRRQGPRDQARREAPHDAVFACARGTTTPPAPEATVATAQGGPRAGPPTPSACPTGSARPLRAGTARNVGMRWRRGDNE